MGNADLVRRDANEMTMFLMQGYRLQIVISLENVKDMPEASDGSPEWSWNV